jgi:acetolactate synthase-1/2/3 large subunit
MDMRAADLLVRCLENEGVERVFGIPGEENLDVMDAMKDSGIEFVLTRHENAAAFIAATLGRLTGEPHVCISTLGPGSTNMMTGVAEAFLSYLPLIALTGQVGCEHAYAPRKQFIDQVAMYAPITKESVSLRSPSRIPVLVRRSFDLAKAERPGPVHLELPEDVMKVEVEGKPLRKGWHEQAQCELEATLKVRELLLASQRPLILAGPGAIRTQAADALRSFARAWRIPVAHTWHGSGILPYDDPLSLNTVGLRTKDVIRQGFAEADLVLLIGYDLPEFAPMFWNIGEPKRIAVIDSVPVPSVPRFEPDIQLIGNLRSMLTRLSSEVPQRQNWAASHRVRLEECVDGCPLDGHPVKPQLIVKAVREALDREDIAAVDVGAHLIWMARLYPVYKENTLLMSNGLIPMGIGVPAAIGAKLAYPERKVVAVCGDGGFMMTAAELETAKRLGTNFVTVIFNDAGLGLIKYKHQKAHGRDYGCDFGNPDFVEFADSFGAKGYRVTSAQELKEVLVESLRDDELAVIDVPVDYIENRDLL